MNPMSRLANHTLNENLSYWSLDTLFASSLKSLRKMDGGIRPIAVDNVFRRIASKVSMQSLCARVSVQHSPVRVCFGEAGGAEAAVYATRKFINNARPPDIMLKIGMRNAFNSLRRDHMLKKSVNTFPGICILMHCAYSTASALLIGDEIIASSFGGNQGDPLFPLLFALAVNDITHPVGTPLSIWYLNDVAIVGPSESVNDSYPKIAVDLSSIGLEVNTSQTEFISYCTKSRKSVVHSPKDLRIVPVGDSELLGAPLLVGAVSRIINDKAEKLIFETERLMQIDGHIALFVTALSLSIS